MTGAEAMSGEKSKRAGETADEVLARLAKHIDKNGRPLPPPTAPPPFKVSDLRGAIPKHCFRRSAFWGFAYTARDLALIAACVYCATFIDKAGLSTPATVGLWALYTYVCGCFMTGIWVLAHECGHGAFSDYGLLNDAVGTVLHSSLLVPYHAWRISHANHHKFTASIEHDEVFVPRTGAALSDVEVEAPIMTAALCVNTLLLGWCVARCGRARARAAVAAVTRAVLA